jgi:hypothetical protein
LVRRNLLTNYEGQVSLVKHVDNLQDFIRTALLRSVLIGQYEWVSALLKKSEEAKTMDACRVCELLAAACWNFLRPKDCVKIVTMLLNDLLQFRGVKDDIFDSILNRGCRETSMDWFLKPGDRQFWIERVKELVQGCYAGFRVGLTTIAALNHDDSDVELGDPVL